MMSDKKRVYDNDTMEVIMKAGLIYDWINKNANQVQMKTDGENHNYSCCLNVLSNKTECPFRQNENSPLCMMRLYDIEPGQTLARQYCLLAALILDTNNEKSLRILREQPVSDDPSELTRDIILSVWKKFFKNVKLNNKDNISMKDLQKKYRKLVSLFYGTGIYLI